MFGQILHHDRCTRDRSRDRCGMDLRSTQPFWNLQQEGTFIECHLARATFEAEITFRPDTRKGVVVKKKFRARLDPSR